MQYGGLLEPVEWSPRLSPTSLACPSTRGRATARRGSWPWSVLPSSTAACSWKPRASKPRRRCTPTRSARYRDRRDRVAEPRLWSPERPALYTEKARLLGGGDREIDGVTERFGIRSIEARGRQLLLNGEPIRIRGVNRYNELPGRGPAGEEAAIRADLAAVKAAGANFVRVHFPQTPTTLRIADELGLLYMEEVPLNWWRATWHRPPPPQYQNDRIIDSAEQALDRMVRRDQNHPSIVVWSMSNECLTSDSLGIHAMERLIRRARSLDSTRLVTYVANHAIESNAAFRLADLVAVNLYYGMWDGDVADRVSQLDSLVRGPTRERLARSRAPSRHAGAAPEFGTIGVPGSGGDVHFSELPGRVRGGGGRRCSIVGICGGVVWSWADHCRRGFTNDFPAFFGPFGLVT